MICGPKLGKQRLIRIRIIIVDGTEKRFNMNTMPEKQSFLTALTAVLGDRGTERIYPCIWDLVGNGLVLSRVSADDRTPQRQDITQYLAAWCRYAGLTAEECRMWLTEYCVDVLSSISKTPLSGIRHSTKSNVRYIYRSGIRFVCEREENWFKAKCSANCPAYADSGAKANHKPDCPSDEVHPTQPAERVKTTILPVKAIYREQVEEALEFMRLEIRKGTKRERILQLLNERGLKTRTGRKWTYSILQFELAKMKKAHDDPGNIRSDERPSQGPDVEQSRGG